MTAPAWPHGTPECWEWEPELPDVPLSDDPIVMGSPRLVEPLTAADHILRPMHQLQAWQAGRCAVCGTTGRVLLEDHDHASGLTRGYLCGSCNVGEGVNRSPLFSLYRWRHPTSILGLTIRYAGIGIGATEPHRAGRAQSVDLWGGDNATDGLL